MNQWINALKWGKDGLMPVIIQDAKSHRVLTLCYMNEEALSKTWETKTVYVYRRSQQKLMKKGETSGHVQMVKEVFADCEGKSLLILVEQKVAACHQGYFSCYFSRRTDKGEPVVTDRRVFDPTKIYP